MVAATEFRYLLNNVEESVRIARRSTGRSVDQSPRLLPDSVDDSVDLSTLMLDAFRRKLLAEKIQKDT